MGRCRDGDPMIGRREILARLAIYSVTVSALRPARAQPVVRTPRVVFVHPSLPLADMVGPNAVDSNVRLFVQRLRELGHVEGRNIIIERRSAQGQLERLPVLMNELVGLPVDVIVAVGNAAQEAHRATGTIPIVAWVDDPVANGLTSDLARPTGNVTGVSGTASLAIHGKRLQLLKEAAPKSSRIAAIDFKYVDGIVTPGTHRRRLAVEAAARDLGVALIPAGIDTPEDFEEAFGVIVRERADAIIDMGTPNNFAHRRLIIDFAAKRRLPAIYTRREFPEAGGLMSYAPRDLPASRMAEFVDKILKGAKPADLPFEQPTNFALVINLKTAANLRLPIPHSLLLNSEVVG
jgi:putative ABC transport system substrate-binding protein